MSDDQKETHDLAISGAAIVSGAASCALAPLALGSTIGIEGEAQYKFGLGAALLAVVGAAVLATAAAKTDDLPSVGKFSPHVAVAAAAAVAGVAAIGGGYVSRDGQAWLPTQLPSRLQPEASWLFVLMVLAAAAVAIAAAIELPKAQALEKSSAGFLEPSAYCSRRDRLNGRNGCVF